MSMEVTVILPDTMAHHLGQFGKKVQRPLAALLNESLELLWPTLDEMLEQDLYPNVATLPDDKVLALADLKMDEAQNQRLAALQTKGKQGALTVAERYELLALLQIYRLGQLRKSEGLAEAVRRGLRQPLPA